MRLKKYLPEFVSSIKEFQELDQTISVELDELRNKLQQIQSNQFIETSNDEGLKRYEQMLKIATVNDMDMRRFNILSKYNSTIPFTITWLTNMLNAIVGKGDFLLHINYNTYTLTISIMSSKEHLIPTLYRDLRKKIPCNLVLNITTLAPVQGENYIGTFIRTADKISI